MESTAAAGGASPPATCAAGEHPAQLAAKLAAGAQALCSMAEAAAAAAAAEQVSEGETFDHQREAAGEQEAEGGPVLDSAADAGGCGARACSQCGQTRTTTWRRHPLSRDWACNSCYHKASRQLKKRDQGGLSAAGSASMTLADAAGVGAAADKRARLGDAPSAGAGAPPPTEQYLAVIDMQHQVLLTHVCMLQRQVSDLQQAVAALPSAVQDAVTQQRGEGP